MTEAIEKVRAIPLFAGLDDDALGRVASCSARSRRRRTR